jgi:hypothetical protein
MEVNCLVNHSRLAMPARRAQPRRFTAQGVQVRESKDLWIPPDLMSKQADVQIVQLGSEFRNALWIVQQVVQQERDVAQKRLVADEDGLRGFLDHQVLVAEAGPESGENAVGVFLVVEFWVARHDWLEVSDD